MKTGNLVTKKASRRTSMEFSLNLSHQTRLQLISANHVSSRSTTDKHVRWEVKQKTARESKNSPSGRSKTKTGFLLRPTFKSSNILWKKQASILLLLLRMASNLSLCLNHLGLRSWNRRDSTAIDMRIKWGFLPRSATDMSHVSIVAGC